MTQPTHIATTTSPAVAADIQRRYPGSYIITQGDHIHIFTPAPHKPPPNGHKPPPPTTKKHPTKSIFDTLHWWIGAIGLLILLIAIS